MKNKNYNEILNELQDSLYLKDKRAYYYYDPKDESIIQILKDINAYRLENAFKAIFNRNIFIILGNTFISAIITLATISNRIAKLFKKSLISDKQFKSYWLNLIFNCMAENILFKYINWFILLNIILFCKIIYMLFKTIMFIYTKILKPLFLPIAIILAALIWSSNRNNNNSYKKFW